MHISLPSLSISERKLQWSIQTIPILIYHICFTEFRKMYKINSYVLFEFLCSNTFFHHCPYLKLPTCQLSLTTHHILQTRNWAQMDQVSTIQHYKAKNYLNQDLNLGLLITTLMVCHQHIRGFLMEAKFE